MSNTMINYEALRDTKVNSDPFPFLVIPNFLCQEHLNEIVSDFPHIESRGSYPLKSLQYGENFQKLIKELESAELRAAIGRKLDMNLEDRPTLITVRGKTDKKDGHIHKDTKSKLVTLLLYFNSSWIEDGGRLRILRNNHDLDDYVTEIPPSLGTCLIFKVTDNCWHGHKVFSGIRRTIQLNYLTNEKELEKHLSRHGLSAKLKNIFQRLIHPAQYTE
ncbi:MAG: hypothetical protein C5B54_08775 [Acidobacteria bacterium]|nr:MAG: hypothetical protein C5B54_08775 [Acidobacteriota bacterium]